MSGLWTAIVTALIIALSAFFVAVEFALMAAKRHRLEDAAVSSRSARAALRSSAELTLLLAGSQLGITVCTLALGAITKPAVHHALTPLLAAAGLGATTADVLAFILALLIVTFLHLVVGEMAPKSWAIAHPERSAILLALPMRGFMALTRPLLRALNYCANWMVRKLGVEPVDEVASAQDPDGLRQLVEHSANVGALAAGYRAPIESALDLNRLTIADLITADAVTFVGPDATVADVQRATLRSGHLRIVVGTPGRGIDGVVHVRDTLQEPDLSSPVGPYVREMLHLNASTPLHQALAEMREARAHLVAVRSHEADLAVVSLADILPKLFPRSTASADEGAADSEQHSTHDSARAD